MPSKKSRERTSHTSKTNPNLEGYNADQRPESALDRRLSALTPALDSLSTLADAAEMDLARRDRDESENPDVALPFTPETPWPPATPRLAAMANGINNLIDLAVEADADQLSRGLTTLEATRQLPIPEYLPVPRLDELSGLDEQDGEGSGESEGQHQD